VKAEEAITADQGAFLIGPAAVDTPTAADKCAAMLPLLIPTRRVPAHRTHPQLIAAAAAVDMPAVVVDMPAVVAAGIAAVAVAMAANTSRA
jgi:hypothetical protein